MHGTGVNYLDHLARDSARFAEALRGTPPRAPVPSCPGWDADDLLWHLGEVQWFWGTIVSGGLTREQAEELKPDRPAGRDGLLAFYQRVSHDLGVILAARAPGTPAWTWSADHSVGFIRRRQAHEALIHRVDAELTAGRRTGMDARLSADGVDEALRVMYGGEVPDWGTFTPAGPQTVRLHATDTGDSWLVTPGRFTGTDPGDHVSYDQPCVQAASRDTGGPAEAHITGSAADLDCWLWHRPPVGQVDRSGDDRLLGRFDASIASGIN
jgi:uncharacterized protein (TIGR03083 family)